MSIPRTTHASTTTTSTSSPARSLARACAAALPLLLAATPGCGLDEDTLSEDGTELRASNDCEVVPLHQYFSNGALDHLYTMDWESMGRAAGSGGYSWAGIEGYGCANEAPGTTELYEYVRQHNGDINHFYSVTYYGSTIYDSVKNYSYVGVAGYVYSSNSGGRKALNQYYSHSVSGTGKRDHFYTTNPSPALDPAWGYGSPVTQGHLKMSHGIQEVPIGYDHDRVLNFYSRPFHFQLWYDSNGRHSIYERCADSSSPDHNVVYRSESRNFDDGRLDLNLAVGNQCYVREVGVHAGGEWMVRYVTYEAPVAFSY